MNHSSFMDLAIEQASHCIQQPSGGPFGAVVVKNERVIGVGRNQVTTHNDPTAHAEVCAIRDACMHLQSFSLVGCDIYTSCEPCPMCLGAIYWARIGRIFYAANRTDAATIGFDDQTIYDELSKPIGERSVAMIECGRKQVLEIFQAWEEKSDKIRY